MARRSPALLLAAGVLLAWLNGAPLVSATPPPANLPRGAGAALGWDCCEYSAVQTLQAQWFTDYRSSNARMDGPGHVFLVEHQITPPSLIAFAAQHPGHAWQLGNEPNDTTGYGDVCGTPAQCGARWQAQAAAIRAGDPGAALIGPGLANADVSYAQALVTAGADRFDAWNVHLYARTADAAWVLARVRAFQAWAHRRGDTRPIIVGEVGIAPDEPESLAAPVLRTVGAAFPRLGVQAWAWFPAQTTPAWPGGLLDTHGALTAAGWAFRGLLQPARGIQ